MVLKKSDSFGFFVWERGWDKFLIKKWPLNNWTGSNCFCQTKLFIIFYIGYLFNWVIRCKPFNWMSRLKVVNIFHERGKDDRKADQGRAQDTPGTRYILYVMSRSRSRSRARSRSKFYLKKQWSGRGKRTFYAFLKIPHPSHSEYCKTTHFLYNIFFKTWKNLKVEFLFKSHVSCLFL